MKAVRILSKVAKKQIVEHSLGDKHFIDNIECEVKFINGGKAWVFPTTDDEDMPLTATHVCYAKLDEYGNVTVL